MSPCKNCGANLPDEARFCLQCGTAVEAAAGDDADSPPAPPAGPEAPLDFVQPALSGGMFLGVLSSLPIVGAANCFCCMWIVGGGGIATFMLSKQRPAAITLGDGAFAGVLSGVFGAVVGTIVSIPARLLQARFLESQPEALEEMLRGIPGLEGPMRDLLMRIASAEISATTLTFTLFTNLLIYSLFAMIGGILTVAVLNQRKKSESGKGIN